MSEAYTVYVRTMKGDYHLRAVFCGITDSQSRRDAYAFANSFTSQTYIGRCAGDVAITALEARLSEQTVERAKAHGEAHRPT